MDGGESKPLNVRPLGLMPHYDQQILLKRLLWR